MTNALYQKVIKHKQFIAIYDHSCHINLIRYT